MPSFHNDFAGMKLGYFFEDEQFPDFGTPYDILDSDTSIANLRRSQGWYLNPSAAEYVNQDYQGSTSLDVLESQLMHPYVLPLAQTYDGSDTCELRCP